MESEGGRSFVIFNMSSSLCPVGGRVNESAKQLSLFESPSPRLGISFLQILPRASCSMKGDVWLRIRAVSTLRLGCAPRGMSVSDGESSKLGSMRGAEIGRPQGCFSDHQ